MVEHIRQPFPRADAELSARSLDEVVPPIDIPTSKRLGAREGGAYCVHGEASKLVGRLDADERVEPPKIVQGRGVQVNRVGLEIPSGLYGKVSTRKKVDLGFGLLRRVGGEAKGDGDFLHPLGGPKVPAGSLLC